MISLDEAKVLFYEFDEPTKTELAQKYLRTLVAKESARNIPQWAAWTESEADAWYQTSVRAPFAAATTLAAMKTVIGTMITVQWATIRMVLAIRDHLWPDL